jgi:hypothetical protein
MAVAYRTPASRLVFCVRLGSTGERAKAASDRIDAGLIVQQNESRIFWHDSLSISGDMD